MQPFVYLAIASLFNHAYGSKISWCEYWNRRGIQRSECQPERVPHWSLSSSQTPEESDVSSMAICDMVSDWSRCQKSNHCPLGLLCWRHGSPCCTPQTSRISDYGSQQCPLPKNLGVRCNVQNPVNWCNSDYDCHRSSSYQKCCPSGCGYNMCLQTGSMSEVQMRISAMSFVPHTCPSMDSINVVCKSRGISWCHTHDQCLQNGVQERSCCPTRCGYNVCLLKLTPTSWIIA